MLIAACYVPESAYPFVELIAATPVVTPCTTSSGTEEERANARLIACAPDLLKGAMISDKENRETNKEVMTADQCAEWLGFNPVTVRLKASAGEIPGRKIGREWRFSRRQLLEWLEHEK